MDIVSKAEDHVFHLFKDRLSPDYIYHNFNHTLRVVRAAETIAKAENVDADTTEALLIAAWFHDSGYIEGAENHEKRSAEFVSGFLKEHKYPEDKTVLVQRLILATELHHEPTDLPEQIMKDADCAHFADANYMQLSELLRSEWELKEDRTFTDLEWAVGNRMMLLHKHRYYTEYAKKHLQPQKENNLAMLQDVINGLSAKQGKKAKKEKEKEKQQEKEAKEKKKDEKPDRGIDTLFRVTLSNHTRLSDIADSKANILLSVNTIIISISLSTLIPKLDSPANAHLVFPTFVMMLFSTVSIIFAILSTRPKVNTANYSKDDIREKRINLLFFGNFYKLTLEEYDTALRELMTDRDDVYGALIKDLYYLGLVLNRKYRLLRITYNIFMVGIIVSVSTFVYAFWTL
jgi:predicted metal-dependent HD superfamily phosphohydrolase